MAYPNYVRGSPIPLLRPLIRVGEDKISHFETKIKIWKVIIF